MSAFILDDTHISALIQFATQSWFPHSMLAFTHDGKMTYFVGNEAAVGQKLIDANIRSVNYRYQKHNTNHEYQYAPRDRVLTPVQAIKACQCFAYQACESPDWEGSEAHSIIEAIKKRAISSLPGYEHAAWEIV